MSIEAHDLFVLRRASRLRTFWWERKACSAQKPVRARLYDDDSKCLYLQRVLRNAIAHHAVNLREGGITASTSVLMQYSVCTEEWIIFEQDVQPPCGVLKKLCIPSSLILSQ